LAQLKTKNQSYWTEEFEVSSQDLEYLSTILLEDELPRSAHELGRALVLRRIHEEQSSIERQLAQGTPYQPRLSYTPGETVVFPALDYQAGEVASVREGHNPELGSFKVIQVQFSDGTSRELAAELETPHRLNNESADQTEGATEVFSDSELDELTAIAAARLDQILVSEPDFTRLASKWFPRDLLVEVNVGHLNLAEAVLDTAGGGPLPTEALLGDLELPEEISPQLRTFSLNYALQEDERFDEVGPAGEVLWYLRPLEPTEVRDTPPPLRFDSLDYDPNLLTSEMLELVKRLDDEWSGLAAEDELTEPLSLVLTYPHWRAGTLPLTSRLSTVFPTGRTQRILFKMVDADSGEEFPAWVVRNGRYVCGLSDWYRQRGIPVGAYLDLSKGTEPGQVNVRPRNRRQRRDWVRVALPIDGKLSFEMRKTAVTCEYDDLIIVEEESPGALDEVWQPAQQHRVPLADLIEQLFPELAKLSPQGTVHAATLYSVVNITYRTPPGPLLAALVTATNAYSPVGDNYWVAQAGLIGGY
jgi:hypothetical protein